MPVTQQEPEVSTPATADGDTRPWASPRHLAVAAVLCVVAALLRMSALGPSSLWLDDAWVALVIKTDTVAETMLVGLTGPGFAFALKGWLGLVGFSETAAQLPAFAFGVVAPGALYLVAVRLGLGMAGGLVAGGLLAAAPVHIEYATRVKHYTLDTLLAVGLLALVLALVEAPTTRRWVRYAATAAAATALSAGTAPLAAGGLLAGGVASLRRRRAVRAGLAATAGWLAFTGAWYVGVLNPRITLAIRGYWADHYVTLNSTLNDVGAGLARMLDGFSVLPALVTAVLLLAGVVMVTIRRDAVTAVALAVPLLAAVIVATLRLAPLGGGRTDSYLYPALALLVAGAVAPLLQRIPASAAIAAAAVVALAMAAPRPDYPVEDVAPLIAELDRQRGPGDVVVVYPSTVWAYALYTDEPVDIVVDHASPWGFRPRVDDAGVTFLPSHRDMPERYEQPVAEAVADASTVWLVASHVRRDLRAVTAFLQADGLAQTAAQRREGALLARWER